MAEIVGGGSPANDDERAVIARLRDHGPADWLVLHNVEIPAKNETFELDLIVVTGRALFGVDVKGTRGRVQVAGGKWHPERRQPFRSPVDKLRAHARQLKGLLSDHRAQLSRVYVAPLVVLTGQNAALTDPGGRDSGNVATFDEFIDVMDGFAVPDRFDDELSTVQRTIVEALTGVVRHPTGPPRVGGWEIVERLGGDDEVTEYRARNVAAPTTAGTVLLRVYRADPFEPEAERTARQRRISNAYVALSRMPAHPNIVNARHFTAIEDESRFVLELEDTHGTSLLRCLSEPDRAVGADTKLRVIRDVLAALAHAHHNRVIHRALSPSTVVLAADGRSLLTGFDHARPGPPREHTLAGELPKVVDPAYLAPECQRAPEAHSAASDVYAAGIVAYHLLTGELPFASSTDQYDRRNVVPTAALSEAGVRSGLIELLGRMCAEQAEQRPTAAEALLELTRLVGGARRGRTAGTSNGGPRADKHGTDFLRALPEGYELTRKFTIRRKLGQPGHFGVAYQVFDMLADTDWVLKLILRDRDSVIERMKHEYKILLNLAPHPNVLRVADANFLPDGETPYLQFEYVEGRDLSRLISAERPLGPADVLQFGIEAARGIAHLHQHGVYHCDIKPSNLLWTEQGCKIIDFNVAVTADSTLRPGGGTSRYAPPDVTADRPPTAADLTDRDTYGLALSLYELLTGSYPWDTAHPPPGEPPRHPNTLADFPELSPTFVTALLSAIAPQRSQRYGSVTEFLTALSEVSSVWPDRPEPRLPERPEADEQPANAFVDYLQTVYSQSTTTNQGTRGKDPPATNLYVSTALDELLLPDVLAGSYRLVIITGNAGDGKTAFLERMLDQAREHGAQFDAARDNGADFTLGGRVFHTNHDGSQDEGELANDAVLDAFFGPFRGQRDGWPEGETRVVAINEGRLIDFLAEHADEFATLREIVDAGIGGNQLDAGVAVINLNNRSVLADPDGTGSIFSRMLDRMTSEHFWAGCASCDLASKCYALHNARTFAHPTAGPRVTERLRSLYRLAHLRGRLHITLRDLRSALAYLLTSGRSCAEIHSLYERGCGQEILDGFYFNSWAGSSGGHDRLLTELRALDVAEVPAPGLERRLDYIGPDTGSALMTFDQRPNHDLALLRNRFDHLPRGGTPDVGEHRRYTAAAKRRFFFECQDDNHSWRLLPYQSARTFLDVLRRSDSTADHLPEVINAINRGEGLTNPGALGDALALQVRHVPGGTIRSYRLFEAARFELCAEGAPAMRYLEGEHDHLLLRYTDPRGQQAELAIRLDLYELLYRLRRGHVPGTSDNQGRYLSLTIFKNVLSAVPYQEILLTGTGTDLRRIRREPDGTLVMAELAGDR